MKFLKAIFRPPTVESVANDQLYDAMRQALAHEAAAEHHAALATMYRQRVERLRSMALQPRVGM